MATKLRPYLLALDLFCLNLIVFLCSLTIMQYLLPYRLKVWVLSWIAHYPLKLKLIISRGLHTSTCVILIVSVPFSTNNTAVLVHTLVTSRIDYCNALFTGVPAKLLHKLQLVQNSAARVLSRTPFNEHISPVLQQLHWLPVKYRVEF